MPREPRARRCNRERRPRYAAGVAQQCLSVRQRAAVQGLPRVARRRDRTIDGRYQRGSTTILVTAGVGYSIVPVRYAAPGSIELIELSL